MQIRGFRARLPLNICVVASANPEDYTNRGRIITPLKDRYGAEIRTHYPKNIAIEIDIMEAERSPLLESDSFQVTVPRFMKEIVAEVTNLARHHGDINQRSGVSVRMSIANYESLISNALRRSLLLRENEAVPRISDLPALLPSSNGKIELETIEDGKEGDVVAELTRQAVRKVFNHHFDLSDMADVLAYFGLGESLEVSDTMPTAAYRQKTKDVTGLTKLMQRLGCAKSPALLAAGLEFVLEGLHLNKKLNKKVIEGEISYWG